MDIKLGPRIASLRRAKSMTQEQLALSLAYRLLLSANGRQVPPARTFHFYALWPALWKPMWIPCCSLRKPLQKNRLTPG